MSANVQNLKFSYLHLTQVFRRFSSSSPSSSTSTPTPTSSSLSEYLSKALGFSEQQSLQICTRLARFSGNNGEKKVSDFYFAGNAFSVIDFLRETGFNDAHIRKIVFTDPQILTSKVDKTLKPKIKVFHDLGFSGSNIVEAISGNHKLIKCKLDSSVWSTVLALRQILCCDDDLISVLRRTRFGYGLTGHDLDTNIDFLKNSGICIETIKKALISQPSLFLRSAEDFKRLVTKVENEFGIFRSAGVFLTALRLSSGYSETSLKSKYRVFESFGWSESDIKALIKVHPCCLMFSEQRIKKSLNFLMKELGYEPKYLISHASLLSCGVEKRLLPRHRILSVLKEKGLIRADFPLYAAVRVTESPFVKRFIVPFKEVHELYTKLTGYSLQIDINAEGDS